MTHYLAHKMEKLDIPSIPEFIEMIADTGAASSRCKASVDLFGLTKDDFIPQVQDIITVGEFYDKVRGRPDHLHVTGQLPDWPCLGRRASTTSDLERHPVPRARRRFHHQPAHQRARITRTAAPALGRPMDPPALTAGGSS